MITTAARDRRIAAAVVQVPFADGPVNVSGFPPGQIARLTVEGLRDEWAALSGRPPHYVPAVGPPGSTALITASGSEEGMRRLVPAGVHYPNRVAARLCTRVPFYRPVRLARHVGCPIFFCIAEHDVVTPPGPALRAAESAPHAEVRRSAIAHFDIYVDEWFDRAVGDQVEFLRRHVLRAGLPAAAASA